MRHPLQETRVLVRPPLRIQPRARRRQRDRRAQCGRHGRRRRLRKTLLVLGVGVEERVDHEHPRGEEVDGLAVVLAQRAERRAEVRVQGVQRRSDRKEDVPPKVGVPDADGREAAARRGRIRRRAGHEVHGRVQEEGVRGGDVHPKKRPRVDGPRPGEPDHEGVPGVEGAAEDKEDAAEEEAQVGFRPARTALPVSVEVLGLGRVRVAGWSNGLEVGDKGIEQPVEDEEEGGHDVAVQHQGIAKVRHGRAVNGGASNDDIHEGAENKECVRVNGELGGGGLDFVKVHGGVHGFRRQEQCALCEARVRLCGKERRRGRARDLRGRVRRGQRRPLGVQPRRGALASRRGFCGARRWL
ncbi:hypothetical protein DFJ74DRAFT_687435 [Hyaloraphidium curvatum]|nr:hypothetical protein DFJ74DRAFT_687435 [Hyaloraphidium curvatum]